MKEEVLVPEPSHAKNSEGIAQPLAQRGALAQAALRYLEPGYSTATHWIASAVGFGRNNERARYLLRKMSAQGLVEPIRTSRGGYIYWWRITEAGRSALSDGRASDRVTDDAEPSTGRLGHK